MKKLTIVSACVLTAVSALAGPLKLQDVSTAAKWIVHADMQRLKGTEMGRYILDQVETGEAQRKLEAFRAVFNVDPRKDVLGATLYGTDNQDGQGVALLRGTFDVERLLVLARGNEGYSSAQHGAHEIHAWQDPQGAAEQAYGAVHPSGPVVLGSNADLVKTALDVLDSPSGPSAGTSGLFNAVPLGGGSDFLVMAADVAGLRATDPRAAMLEQASTLSLVMGEREGQTRATLNLLANDEESASLLESVVGGLLAMAQLGAQQDPEQAKLAQAIRVSREATLVKVGLVFPTTELLAMFEKHKGDLQPGAVPTPAP